MQAIARDTPALPLPPPPSGWRDRLLRWAERLVSQPGFRHQAARLWLTRPLARRRARALFDLVAGFTYSQVLLACVRLALFDRLAAGPQTLRALAPALDLAPEPCRRLLDAAVALRLLRREPPPAGQPEDLARYRLGPLGAPMVGNGALAAMVEHHALLYADLADPLAMLRQPPGQGALARYWAYAGHSGSQALPDAEVARYSMLMAASQPLVADEVLDAYPMAGHAVLMDVGGGEGVFAATALQRWPRLRAVVFDLPAVAARAQVRLAQKGLLDRATAVGGSFLTDALPQGADLVSLVRVVHDHDDEAVLALLRRVHAALPPHGTLLLAEPLAGTPGAQAMGDAYFGLYLWAMGSGRPRSIAQLTALLQQAGFARPRLLANALPLQTRVLITRPDASTRRQATGDPQVGS